MRALQHTIAVFRIGLGVVVVGLFVWLAAPPGRAASSSALWHIVHDLCTVDMKVNHLPAPCTAVDLTRGYAVLKDIRGATQLLVIPTDRVTGIEDPKVLAPDAPNYWQDAWEARSLFEKRAGRPVARDDVGLAVNSIYGRSQSQLHIHLDCIRSSVATALQALEPRIGPHWATLHVDLAGRRYRAMRIQGDDLGERNPFKLLAADPEARANMGLQTLVAVPVTYPAGKPGFVLLSHRADLAAFDGGHGEELLDHHCAVLDSAESGVG